MNSKKLTKRELLFCKLAAKGNAESAALQAGYQSALESVTRRLLSREEILLEIGRNAVQAHSSQRSPSRIGYERLAFGSIADAVKLLYMEDPPPDTLEKMDFFPISEIKRPKDGAMEIKFFDRLQALECLERSEQGEHAGLSPFYQALERGAQALEDSGHSDNGEVSS